MRSGGEGPCEENRSHLAAVPEESVIVISDDEGEVSLGLGNSVLLVEDTGEDSFVLEKKTVEVVDEELAITFSRKAHVMPHARYDCSTHPFSRMEQETQLPIEKNASFCDKCYCYLCDKPASECSKWTTYDYCHCNAHNKSKYWKEQRDTALAGVLTIFKLDLTEIDTELREAGDKLQHFISQLSPVYNQYLEGALSKHDSAQRCTCSCHKEKAANNKCKDNCSSKHVQVRFHNYSKVHQLVSSFLNQVDEGSPKAAAVMLLGAAKELVYHKALPNPVTLKDSTALVKESSTMLMARIVRTLQRLLVLNDYPKILYDKFIFFFQSLPLPPHFYAFTASLNVIRWDSCLLMSVLAGQNITGTRTNKGKKECLFEVLTVVQSRVKRLETEQNYRQLVRYLNVVRCSEYTGLNSLKQKLCFYMCKYGDFPSAASSLLQTKGMSGSISKFFNPALFELHLVMLRTRSCPPENELIWSDTWVPQGGLPLKKGVLLRTALRMLFCNNHLYYDSKSWSALVRIWCTSELLSKEGTLLPLSLYDPDQFVLQVVMSASCPILNELQRQSNVQLPEPFHKSHNNVAELILIVQAIVRFMMSATPPLKGMLELIAAFGLNHWALSLLIDGISSMRELLFQFVSSANKELYEEEKRILDLFNNRGPLYVSQLVPVFLLHPDEGVRSVGFHLLDVVLKNLKSISWSGTVGGSLKVKVLPFINTCMINTVERKKLITVIGRLISRT
ncbi:uncharacterized protein LOC130283856 isoform X2 [Hyla sarda]|nr:uncharacterized protein LOC130283856 isoform X2 [Hyla sarda]XP_056389441.1 uncharacterized protein LOC130283856 isoform X2 [Hyla sarda]XP_056389442.1 uncharacterized protein LOC130283856 isoform X2 [Hyla sarda]